MGQDQRKCVIRDLLHAIVRDVANLDAMRAGGLKIDVIDSHAIAHDLAEIGLERREDLRRERRILVEDDIRPLALKNQVRLGDASQHPECHSVLGEDRLLRLHGLMITIGNDNLHAIHLSGFPTAHVPSRLGS